jgi:hypothetical protein
VDSHLVAFFISWAAEMKITDLFYLFFTFQEPRPLSQADLEEALSTSQKTSVAANEYSRMKSRTSWWVR